MQNSIKSTLRLLSVRVLPVCLALLFLLPSGVFAQADPSAPASTAPSSDFSDVTDAAENIALYCPEADMVLFGKNETDTFHPYALTKLVSILVALDQIDDPDEVFTIEEGMVDRYAHRFGLDAGDSVSYADLMKMMLMRGFDDAACVLARKIGGSDDRYVAMMNEKAAQLGAEHTVFENPTGRDDLGVTTAYDCSLIGAAFCKNRLAMEWAGAESLRTDVSNRLIHNYNYFLSIYYNATGTRYLDSRVTGLIAGNAVDPRMLIASFDIGGYTYVVTVMNAAPDDGCAYVYEIARKLVNEYRNILAYKRVLSKSDLICEIPVSMGDGHDAVVVSPDREFSFFIRTDSDLKKEFTYTYELDVESMEAPVTAGTKVGTLILYRDGTEVGRADLLTIANVSRSMTDYYSGRVRDVVTGRIFLKIVLIVGGIGVVYVFAMAIYRGQKKKKRQQHSS